MNGVGIVEAAIKEAVEKYARELQDELMAKYTAEFEKRLNSQRLEIMHRVVGAISVHEDIRTMQIVVNIDGGNRHGA